MEAQAGPLRFFRHKRFEYSLACFRGRTGSRICHSDLDSPFFREVGFEKNMSVAACCSSRLQGIQ